MPTASRAPLLLALLVLATLSGCTDDGPPLPPDDGHAATPDEAVTLYRAAYLARDAFALDKVLAPAFRASVSMSDADSLFFDPELEWNRDLERTLARRMFDGETGVRADSLAQCPLDPFFNITFGAFSGGWEDAGGGTLSRVYTATGTIDVGEFGVDFIAGNNRIYVQQLPVQSNDRCCALAWQIVRWEDMGVDASKHGNFAWSRIRARWWPDAPEPLNSCP